MLATGPVIKLETVLPDEEATRQLAAEVATMLAPGDVVGLSGGLGSGKTAFARALIRHLAGDPRLEAPSPTFTLTQSYDLPSFQIVHVDLYRIGDPAELDELGVFDMLDDVVTLVEWPEQAGARLPTPRITLTFALTPSPNPEQRHVRMTLSQPPPQSLVRWFNFQRFMHEAGFGDATRQRMQGDASTRIYERLTQGARSAILMISPRRTDGPPVRDGRPYSAIAHLAEDVVPFVAMARALRERGVSAPQIIAADLAEGLLILEDLGSEPVTSGDPPTPIEPRYEAALDVLAALHRQPLPAMLPVAPRVNYRLPSYDIDALLIEAELLLDWYLPQQGRQPSEDMRAAFRDLWRDALAPAMAAPPTWVLRDYHSPNLLWLADREGPARVGVLDFQDAVMGSAAYDVVSLLQDARVDVPVTLEDGLMFRYMKARRAADRDFDLVKFVEHCAVFGAQRATKILGIFARLQKRDGKPQYLRHQPRIWRNLRRSLAHAALAPLKAWYDVNIPAPLR
jgi:tRNA threonylcarbamoyl adenosine modification protein YjeE